MSGVELLGVVLGTLPILLKTVEGFRNAGHASRLFSKKRFYVRKLLNALYEHNQCLSGIVRLLLTRSGYDDVSFVGNDLHASIQSDDIREHIQECLCSEDFSVFMEILRESAEIMDNMTKALQGLVVSAKVSLIRLVL
jgi:hypothetical protein